MQGPESAPSPSRPASVRVGVAVLSLVSWTAGRLAGGRRACWTWVHGRGLPGGGVRGGAWAARVPACRACRQARGGRVASWSPAAARAGAPPSGQAGGKEPAPCVLSGSAHGRCPWCRHAGCWPGRLMLPRETVPSGPVTRQTAPSSGGTSLLTGEFIRAQGPFTALWGAAHVACRTGNLLR